MTLRLLKNQCDRNMSLRDPHTEEIVVNAWIRNLWIMLAKKKGGQVNEKGPIGCACNRPHNDTPRLPNLPHSKFA